MRATVDVVREGDFRCDFRMSPEKCGLNADLAMTREFRYEVRVRAKSLDRNGFGMDNREIAAYFRDAHSDSEKTFVSCERLGLDAARYFYNQLHDRGQGCEFVTVKIWGFPGAYVEVTLRDNGDGLLADGADIYGALDGAR